MRFSSVMYVTLSLVLIICLLAGGCAKGEGPDNCPSMAPPPMNQTGPCCYRSSNATRLDTPAFRIASLRLISPSGTLSSSFVNTSLQSYIDQEVFNWVIRVDATASGPLTVQLGEADRSSDGRFSLFPQSAGSRWTATMTTGTLEGEDVTTTAFPGVVTFGGENLVMMTNLHIPVYTLAILHMPMTANRSCVGFRTTRWDTAVGGVMSGFIRVADAKAQGHALSSPPASVDPTLCDVIAGDIFGGTNCDTTPQAMWPTLPDSLCMDTTCTANTMDQIVCDPSTPEGSTGPGGKPGCNAWELVAQFDAQGVEVE